MLADCGGLLRSDLVSCFSNAVSGGAGVVLAGVVAVMREMTGSRRRGLSAPRGRCGGLGREEVVLGKVNCPDSSCQLKPLKHS